MALREDAKAPDMLLSMLHVAHLRSLCYDMDRGKSQSSMDVLKQSLNTAKSDFKHFTKVLPPPL